MTVHPGLSTMLFSGVGSAARKSVALSSVSMQGPLRVAEVVLLSAGAGLPSKVAAVPYPSRSTTVASALIRSTRPLAPLMAAVPVTSGVGRSAVPPVPAAIWTR